MHLRTRFAAEIGSRLRATLPEAMATVWDHQAVLVAIEQIKVTPAGGTEGGIKSDWERIAALSGIVRAELRADRIDTLQVEPLIATLVTSPVHLRFDPGVPEGTLSEQARLVLLDWRDVVRDSQVVSALRFSLEGTIARRRGPGQRPRMWIGQAPGIGPGIGPDHMSDYRPVEGGAR